MSTSKRELQRKNREKAIKKAKAKKTMGYVIGGVVAALIIGCIAYWIYYANFFITKPVDDYSAGLTEDGMIEDVKALDYVELCDYSSINISYDELVMTEEEVEAEIASIQATNKEYVTDAGEVLANGDRINLDYVGSVDGVEFEGGSTGGAGTEITLGSAGYIPGFEEQLVGRKVGESFDINVTFPEDYGKEELEGKDAVFAITLNGVYREAPLTDEYIQENYGDVASTVEEYKQHLRDTSVETKLETYAMDFVMENSKVNSYPEKYIKVQKGILKDAELDMLQMYADAGMPLSWKDYLEQSRGISESEFEAELRINAEELTRKELILQAIFEQEGMVISNEEVNKTISEKAEEDMYYNQIMEQYGRGALYRMTMTRMVEEFLEGKLNYTE